MKLAEAFQRYSNKFKPSYS